MKDNKRVLIGTVQQVKVFGLFFWEPKDMKDKLIFIAMVTNFSKSALLLLSSPNQQKSTIVLKLTQSSERLFLFNTTEAARTVLGKFV